jgi:hypothetical protein
MIWGNLIESIDALFGVAGRKMNYYTHNDPLNRLEEVASIVPMETFDKLLEVKLKWNNDPSNYSIDDEAVSDMVD